MWLLPPADVDRSGVPVPNRRIDPSVCQMLAQFLQNLMDPVLTAQYGEYAAVDQNSCGKAAKVGHLREEGLVVGNVRVYEIDGFRFDATMV